METGSPVRSTPRRQETARYSLRGIDVGLGRQLRLVATLDDETLQAAIEKALKAYVATRLGSRGEL